MNSQQVQDMRLMYEAVYNDELWELANEYNNTVYDEDIVEVATEYFYTYGLNEDGINILIEKVGLESFVEYVYELSEDLILTEARKVSKAKKQPGTLRSRQQEKLAAQRAAAERKETEEKEPESEGADTEAKREQPKSKKPVRDAIARNIFRAVDAYKAGMERHKAATETAGRLASETGKTLGKIASVTHEAGRRAGEHVKKHGLKSLREEVESDLFDAILEHLVAEGFADTNEAALAIMANMSEEWRQSIVEGGFNSSGRYDVGGGRTVGPVAGAVRSLFSGNLPKGQTYVPPSPQRGTNRPPAVPSSKDDSGKLTDFGAGGGKAKLKTGMSVGQVERQGRRNKGDYSG